MIILEDNKIMLYSVGIEEVIDDFVNQDSPNYQTLN